jgi:uroporphyrinogen-III synthase
MPLRSLRNRRIVAFAGRQARPVAARIEAHGGRPLVAPPGRGRPLDAPTAYRNGIRALIGREAPGAVFVGPAPVDRVHRVAARRGWLGTLRRALRDATVAARDVPTAMALRGHDLPVHYVPDEAALAPLIGGVARRIGRTGDAA